MSKPKKKVSKDCEEKTAIEELLKTVKNGEIQLNKSHEVWSKIYSFKEAYIRHVNSQSWNAYIGNVFERLVYSIMKRYISELSSKEEFKNLSLFTEEQIEGNDYLAKKLSVRYGKKESVLPDTDMAIVDYDFSNPWNSVVVAIISCKTSLRERIAQACYWKLKLVSSDTTKHIRVFLATSDNDDDFSLSEKGEKSRDRIIAEYELDGIYILRGDFKHEWESSKVKHYEQIFDDLVKIFARIKKS